MTSLVGKKALLVEDEILLAILFEDMLSDMGMAVVGPYRTVKEAMGALDGGAEIDIALLDIDLGRETSASVADALIEKSVPFLFTTGFGSTAIAGYDDKPVLGKPFTETQLMLRMRAVIQDAG